MRKGSPESAGTQPPKEQRRLAGHPPSKLPQVMQPRTHPGSRARRGPLTAQKTQEGSGTTAPLCAVHNCPGDLRPQPLYVCAVENCPGDLRNPSPTVCSGELPRRPQHCFRIRGIVMSWEIKVCTAPQRGWWKHLESEGLPWLPLHL